MDLEEITKRLNKLAYRSKPEFAADLDLIWNNWLKYNASPVHPLRPNAIAMKEQTHTLLDSIPDIVTGPSASETPMPATPVTSVHPRSPDNKGQIGGEQKATNAQLVQTTLPTSQGLAVNSSSLLDNSGMVCV